MTDCQACQPEHPSPGTPGVVSAGDSLYLWPSTPQARARLRQTAADKGLPEQAFGDDCLRWEIGSLALEAVLSTQCGGLSRAERDDTRALLMQTGVEPGLADFRRVTSLERLWRMQRGRWLSDLLAEDRYETHFQPIVNAHAPEEVVAHECLLRGRTRDGDLISPADLFSAAKGAGLLFQLDLAARRKAVRTIAQSRIDSLALINFTPTSIYDPATCLRSTVALVNELGLDPKRIVFEVIETEQANEGLLKSILSVYRGAGFQVAVDDFGSGYSSLNLVHVLRPDFIKLDMALIRGVDSDPYKARLADGILDMARALSIRTIAEGVETREEWEWVRDHGADMAQGYLFGRPGPPASLRPSAAKP